MTPQEAIKRIKNHNEIHSRKEQHFAVHITEALNMACEALEKQIPKKPIKKNPICYEKTKDGTEFIAYDYFCPDCNKQIKATEHHCKCGQALDWSDTE